MFTPFSVHPSDRMEVQSRTIHGGRTPGPVKRIYDQNAAFIQTTGRGRKATGFPFTPGKTNTGKDAMVAAKTPRMIKKHGALLDKTPFPNRQNTPNAMKDTSLEKISKPLFITESDTVDCLASPRPSSTRKTLKIPRSASKLFDITPPQMSGSWDVSEPDISIITSSLEESASIPEADIDEPEYMPPTAIDSNYDLDFDMPDFKMLGSALANFSRREPDDYDPEDFVDDQELLRATGWHDFDKWKKLKLPDVDDDDDSPFGKPLAPSKPTTQQPNASSRRPIAPTSTVRQTVPPGRVVSGKASVPSRGHRLGAAGAIASRPVRDVPEDLIAKDLGLSVYDVVDDYY